MEYNIRKYCAICTHSLNLSGLEMVFDIMTCEGTGFSSLLVGNMITTNCMSSCIYCHGHKCGYEYLIDRKIIFNGEKDYYKREYLFK